MLGRNGTGMSQCRSVLIKENEFTVVIVGHLG